MEILGQKVRHNIYGTGVVSDVSGKFIYIEFLEKTLPFMYPGAFETFLTADDPEVQAAITKKIEESKVEKQKQREEAAARKTEEEQVRATLSNAAHKAKKRKSFDEMFAPDYHAEKLARQPILTYQQVEDQFGIRITGFGRGINPTDKTVVLISSIEKTGGSFVYHDRWTEDGDYLYSGEGKTGNQLMTKGNLAIRDAALNGKTIHLFVKFSPQDYYYQGVFALAGFSYEDDRDEDGNIRKEYKFRLKKVPVAE